LWPEVYRIICNVRPQFVLLENVTGHLSLGFGRVLGDLAESGYDAQWDCIPAAAVGAPHRRDRVFILATRTAQMADSDSIGCVHGQTTQHSTKRKQHAQRDASASSATLADSHNCRCYGRTGFVRSSGRPQFTNSSQWAIEPNVGRVANGIPNRVDRLKGLGNAVVPQVAEWIGKNWLING
jgi:DNA (cytosine-5)-methyltransferase 1